jgi:cytochrome c biogenesis protein
MAEAARVARASRRGPANDALQPLWRLLTSVRIAVFFIGALALVGLLGVLIPQVPEAMRGNDAAVDAWVDSQRGTFGPLTDVMRRAGLFMVFQQQWFALALGLLVVNVGVCVFNRWSPTFRNVFRPPERVPESFFDNAHNRATLAAADAGVVTAALRSARFSLRVRRENGATYIFADRFAWAQLATFVSHLALVLFIAGGLVSALTGFTSNAFAGEGTTVPVFAVTDPDQIQVRVDDAVGVYGERGNPLDFRTRLTIFRNGEQVDAGTMTVNDPLEYGGYRFHQVAFFPYGAELRVRETATGNTVLHETFPLEEITAAARVTIADAGGRTLLDDVIAPTDFLQGASGSLVAVPGTEAVLWIGLRAASDEEWELIAFDPRGGETGAQVRVRQGGDDVLAGLRVAFAGVESLPSAVGVDLPDGSGTTLAQLVEAPDGGDALLLVRSGSPALSLAPGEPVVTGAYEYTFEGAREFAGISVKRDRGAWFIWVATGMLLAGLAITFYVPRRRLWLKMTSTATHVAALAEKSGGFEDEMRRLARRAGLPPPPGMAEGRA